ncbi:hypothetical protein Ddc_14186 [Ditylenchus destructor]|nr:hypothetical protein Ddc_14186 [Ditylenchus destructor]
MGAAERGRTKSESESHFPDGEGDLGIVSVYRAIYSHCSDPISPYTWVVSPDESYSAYASPATAGHALTQNAAIFASIVGIIASEVLVVAKIFVFALSSRVYWNYMADVILFFISSLFYFLALRGLKKARESIVLIFIFAQGIILLFVASDALLLLYTLIADPGCTRYWPLITTHHNYDAPFYSIVASTATIFQYTAYGIILYFVMSCGLYWTIWRGYKFLKMTNLKTWEISPVPIPAVCNTSYVTENLSTAPELTSTSAYHRYYEQQNQPPGDCPTFFDHQKCVEHERNILI